LFSVTVAAAAALFVPASSAHDDWVDFGGYIAPVYYAGHNHHDEIHGTSWGDPGDTLRGMAGPDDVWGREGPDTLEGNNGHDHLRGGNGHDWLYGGDGNDVLDCGAGDDHANGGSGADDYINCEHSS
jgi:Ca2+-binding RTX toxin-like protein